MYGLDGHQLIWCSVSTLQASNPFHLSRHWCLIVRVLKYKSIINHFISLINEPTLSLSEDEWSSIQIISQWLKLFRDATEQMSATKHVTLSATHAIFHSLQDHLRRALSQLPSTVPTQLRSALIQAHLKLSDYHRHFDESPFYLWSCRAFLYPCTLLKWPHTVQF